MIMVNNLLFPMHEYIHVYVHSQVCVCMCVCVCACVCVCMFVHVYVHVCVHECVCVVKPLFISFLSLFIYLFYLCLSYLNSDNAIVGMTFSRD